jgi:hypothetical protein
VIHSGIVPNAFEKLIHGQIREVEWNMAAINGCPFFNCGLILVRNKFVIAAFSASFSSFTFLRNRRLCGFWLNPAVEPEPGCSSAVYPFSTAT